MLTEIQLVQQNQFLFPCVLDLVFSKISMHLNLQVLLQSSRNYHRANTRSDMSLCVT